MRDSPASRLGALVALAAIVALGTAAWAQADFTASATAGPLTVSTATVPAAAAPTAVLWGCGSRGFATAAVLWDEDALPGLPATARVTVLRGSSPSGPWTAVASDQPQDGALLDAVQGVTGSVYYAAQLTEGSWQGAVSAPARVLLGCRGGD